MKGARQVPILVLGVCVLLATFVGYALLSYSPAPVDPAWEAVPSTGSEPAAVSVRFTGTSTLLFNDGETQWMVDGWFSRPGPLRLVLGSISPDLDAIEAGLAANGVSKLAAVFPVHSHYDHAMDAPEVARRTGALLIGSESTANIGRGWGLPESQIRVVENRVAISLGRFSITPIVSRHFQFPDPEFRKRALGRTRIDAPLVPPVSAFDYRVGEAYVLHVSHPAGNWLIVGSAGYVEGALEGFSADVVFLGVGGLGSQTQEYAQMYWRETVGRVRPERLIPIHYDSLTAPAEGPFRGAVVAEQLLAGGEENTLAFLRQQQASNPGLRFQLLPRYTQVVLFP